MIRGRKGIVHTPDGQCFACVAVPTPEPAGNQEYVRNTYVEAFLTALWLLWPTTIIAWRCYCFDSSTMSAKRQANGQECQFRKFGLIGSDGCTLLFLCSVIGEDNLPDDVPTKCAFDFGAHVYTPVELSA